jgi:hypothetical protein
MTRKDYMGAHEWCFYGWGEGAAHRVYEALFLSLCAVLTTPAWLSGVVFLTSFVLGERGLQRLRKVPLAQTGARD